MKDYNKDKEWSYLMHLDANNLYGCTMSQKFPFHNSEWEENTLHFDEKLW